MTDGKAPVGTHEWVPEKRWWEGEEIQKEKNWKRKLEAMLLRQLELETAEQGRSVKVYSILIALAGSTFLPEGKT